MTSQLPAHFGSWTAFRSEWLCGDAHGLTEQEVAPALRALVRLWPGYVSRMLGHPVRGPLLAIKAIHIGRILEATEALRDATGVVKRLPHDGDAALAELEAAVLLERCGLAPAFVPQVDQRTPDLTVLHRGRSIHFEVKSPTRAAHQQVIIEELMQDVAAFMEAAQRPVSLGFELPADQRAEAQLGSARGQLRKGECNVVMLHVTKTVDGRRQWPSIIDRAFQPGRNTRFSAAVLWSNQFHVGEPSPRFTWHLVLNPYASMPVPGPIRDALRTFAQPR